ncbi:hypothetical protein RHOFW104T7_15390 [Rhodanobacter thiooxydans]|uniref:DUF4156 domain-containing protein n=1 Tax=Rhodanobacter thiooxydans TaxID=416169 RepID=A0A154QFT1_9GAMM|nr:DUF4156 domain-containing protein [Rhodanobacter thiooxydans]EIL98072.1 hypothetical protein UUA_12880 [Rhodanobacter thiooxydans LCS2]KZC23088.1 hypothetical protein RHOFW104T7_15390 [Rhodanobacter thiooxydans]MCW0203601.1 DUF4156 domain-containing protein [Rhodanobacter thiooxydans]
MRKTLLLLVPVLLLGACSWGITLDDAAKNVRTAWSGDVSSCRELGKVTVSVMDRVGPVDRNDIKVRDELEVLARNEAAKMHADTIKPLAEPADGSQPWGAYQCGATAVPPAAGRHPVPASKGDAQTFPIKSG